MKHLISTCLILFICLLPLKAEDNPDNIKQDQYTSNTIAFEPGTSSFNIKIMPAFYLRSLGLELEYNIGPAFSIGINALGVLGNENGSSDGFRLKPEEYLDDGYRLEFAMKYYFSKNAPLGLYAQVNAAYSRVIYFDGNTRPYTFHNRWRDFNGTQPIENLNLPNEISGGLGIGYQLVIIPDQIIGNVMIGAQAQTDEAGEMFIGVYLSPSIGIAF